MKTSTVQHQRLSADVASKFRSVTCPQGSWSLSEIRWHWSAERGSKSTASPILSADFHPMRPLLATGGADGCAKLWRVSRPSSTDGSSNPPAFKFVSVLCHPARALTQSVRWSRSGELLATGHANGQVCIWFKLRDGAPPPPPPGALDAGHPDATAAVETWTAAHTLMPSIASVIAGADSDLANKHGDVVAVSWSADDAFLAVAYGSPWQMVVWWDVAGGREVARHSPHARKPVLNVCMSPSGLWGASIGDDRALAFYSARAAKSSRAVLGGAAQSPGGAAGGDEADAAGGGSAKKRARARAAFAGADALDSDTDSDREGTAKGQGSGVLSRHGRVVSFEVDARIACRSGGVCETCAVVGGADCAACSTATTSPDGCGGVCLSSTKDAVDVHVVTMGRRSASSKLVTTASLAAQKAKAAEGLAAEGCSVVGSSGDACADVGERKEGKKVAGKGNGSDVESLGSESDDNDGEVKAPHSAPRREGAGASPRSGGGDGGASAALSSAVDGGSAASPAGSPPVTAAPYVAGGDTTAVSAVGRNLLLEEQTLCSLLSRQLDISPDGLFVAVPTGRAVTLPTMAERSCVYIYAAASAGGGCDGAARALPIARLGACAPSTDVVWHTQSMAMTAIQGARFAPCLFEVPQGVKGGSMVGCGSYTHVVAAWSASCVYVYETYSGKCLARLGGRPHLAAIHCVAWARDASFLVIVASDGFVSTLTLAPGTLPPLLSLPTLSMTRRDRRASLAKLPPLLRMVTTVTYCNPFVAMARRATSDSVIAKVLSRLAERAAERARAKAGVSEGAVVVTSKVTGEVVGGASAVVSADSRGDGGGAAPSPTNPQAAGVHCVVVSKAKRRREAAASSGAGAPPTSVPAGAPPAVAVASS